MLQFDNTIVEKALLDHYENPRISTYLNEKGAGYSGGGLESGNGSRD